MLTSLQRRWEGRWNPRGPAQLLRAQESGRHALPLLTEAFARLSKAIDLVFVHDGLTDEAYDQNVRWSSLTGTATGTRRC